MAEYIEREKAIDFVKQYTPHIDGETTMQCVKRTLENVPSADVVKVVRCKDCKHLIKEKMICTHIRNRIFNTGFTTFSNHYCSYGELKECKK